MDDRELSPLRSGQATTIRVTFRGKRYPMPAKVHEKLAGLDRASGQRDGPVTAACGSHMSSVHLNETAKTLMTATTADPVRRQAVIYARVSSKEREKRASRSRRS